jgi:hypothetical protein
MNMGIRYTPEEAAALYCQQLRKLRHADQDIIPYHRHADEEPEEADEGKESVLAGKMMKWCKEHGFPCQCNRMSIKARGFVVPGWPD